MHATLATLVVLAALSPGGSEMWSAGEEEYLKAVASRNEPAEARRHLAEAARYFEQSFATNHYPYSEQVPGAALPPYLAYGNTLFLTGRRAEAVAAYRRGLALSADPRLDRQLTIAESAMAGTDNPMPMRFAVSRWTPLLGTIAISGMVLGVLAVWAAGRRKLRSLRIVSALAACMSLLGLIAVHELHADPRSEIPGTSTVRRVTPLRVGNGEHFEPIANLAPLRAGQGVRVRSTRGSWVRVECPEGTTGWLPAEALLR